MWKGQFGPGGNGQGEAASWPALWGAPDNQNKCQKNTKVTFTALPIALSDILAVEPMGELKQGHIIPGDHIGINYQTSPATQPVAVYAPADGMLVNIESHPYTPPPGYPTNMRHYHVYLMHSCTLFTGFVHLTDFLPEILSASPELKKLHQQGTSQYQNLALAIPLTAGQQLGTSWSFGLLGMVTVDLTHTNTGYLNPDSYTGENWRVHSVAPFDYFEKSLKTQILTKNPRIAEPRGGKIDFDVKGKLVGNWFQERTGGLRDVSVAAKQCGNFPCPYWDGHIAFVYDYIDPVELRVSVGYEAGLGAQTPYGVKGNGPDFADIEVGDGVVKYELVGLKDVTRERGYDGGDDPLIVVRDESRFLGTLLVQVIDDDTIKVEIFPGRTETQVTSFTSQARVYQR